MIFLILFIIIIVLCIIRAVLVSFEKRGICVPIDKGIIGDISPVHAVIGNNWNNIKYQQIECYNAKQLTSERLWIPEKAREYLIMTRFYDYVCQNVDEIVYSDSCGHSCAYINKHPRVVLITTHRQNRSEIWNEVNDICIASTLVHEAAHHEAWDKWHDDSERHANKMEIKFHQRLVPFIKGQPYHVEIGGDQGDICGIVLDVHADYEEI